MPGVTDAIRTLQQYDAVFTGHALHNVAWQAVGRMLAGIARALPVRGVIAARRQSRGGEAAIERKRKLTYSC